MARTPKKTTTRAPTSANTKAAASKKRWEASERRAAKLAEDMRAEASPFIDESAAALGAFHEKLAAGTIDAATFVLPSGFTLTEALARVRVLMAAIVSKLGEAGFGPAHISIAHTYGDGMPASSLDLGYYAPDTSATNALGTTDVTNVCVREIRECLMLIADVSCENIDAHSTTFFADVCMLLLDKNCGRGPGERGSISKEAKKVYAEHNCSADFEKELQAMQIALYESMADATLTGVLAVFPHGQVSTAWAIKHLSSSPLFAVCPYTPHPEAKRTSLSKKRWRAIQEKKDFKPQIGAVKSEAAWTAADMSLRFKLQLSGCKARLQLCESEDGYIRLP